MVGPKGQVERGLVSDDAARDAGLDGSQPVIKPLGRMRVHATHEPHEFPLLHPSAQARLQPSVIPRQDQAIVAGEQRFNVNHAGSMGSLPSGASAINRSVDWDKVGTTLSTTSDLRAWPHRKAFLSQNFPRLRPDQPHTITMKSHQERRRVVPRRDDRRCHTKSRGLTPSPAVWRRQRHTAARFP